MDKIDMSNVKKVIFIGSKKLGLECVKAIFSTDSRSLRAIITYDDSNDPRCVLNEFKRFSQKNKINLFIVDNPKKSEEIIKQIQPDFCVVVGWYWIISKDALNCVKECILGIHASLLPKYRGGSPVVWAIINGEKQTGVSLFTFNESIDSGDIWAQRIIEIKETDYISDILNKVEFESVKILKNHYNKILKNEINPYKQNEELATYCSNRLPCDGLINWTFPAEKIYNFIRAQASPYPGAFTFINNKKTIIEKAELVNTTFYGSPGQVARITDKGILVICGNNKPLLVSEIKINNNNRIRKANAIIKSIKVRFKNN